jgi:hypothetical protein
VTGNGIDRKIDMSHHVTSSSRCRNIPSHTFTRTDLIEAAVTAIAARSTDQHDRHVADLAAVRTELTATE